MSTPPPPLAAPNLLKHTFSPSLFALFPSPAASNCFFRKARRRKRFFFAAKNHYIAHTNKPLTALSSKQTYNYRLMKHSIFKIEGLHCQGCASFAEEELSELQGVSSVKCDLQAGQIEVQYDETLVTPQQMADVIAGAGYHLLLPAL